MPWENEELIKPSHKGFVYLIVNKITGKLYIGKKKLISRTSKTVAGRKNKVWTTKPSNWRVYYGSSIDLKRDITKLGKENFDRYILGSYDSLHTVNYAEGECHVVMQVLDEKGTHEWYNKCIDIKKAMRPPEDREYLIRLKKILKEL